MTNVLVPYHLDEYLPDLDVPLAADFTVTAELPEGTPWERMLALHEPVAVLVAQLVRDDRRPVVTSGDCMVSLATLAGMQRAGVEPSIIWFDGHGDVQTLETSASGYLGGMPLRILAGYRPELLAAPLGLRPVAERDMVLVDARDLDPPEAAYLDSSAIRRCAVSDVEIPDGPIFLHVDCDVVNPAELPGLRFPARGGPSLDATATAVARVVGTGRVVACGFGCTWYGGHGAAQRVEPLAHALDPSTGASAR